MKKTIILKISGESLKNDSDLFSKEKLDNLIKQIQVLSKEYKIGIVVGGGNIFRGNLSSIYDIKKRDGDYIAMLATIMNSVFLEKILNNNKIKSKVFSSIKMDQICEEFIIRNVDKALKEDVVCIFAGGTGSPFFSTDTGAALRASQINADFILVGKNGVDGVYDKDPLIYKDANFFEKITYDEIISKDLKVMDITSITLCKENKIKLIVFNANEEDSYIKALNNKIKNTIVE